MTTNWFFRLRQSWSRVALGLILMLAFALRLSHPTLVEFKRDEATVARLAQAIAYEGYLPAVGVDSSLGIDNLPLTLYLMALPLRLWADPLAAVLFTCLLNALAVWVCYHFGKTYFDERVGLIAALLFAVNPWAILYARKIWCRTLPLFTLSLMFFTCETFVRGRRWAFVGVCASLAALLGLQLEALAFIPLVGLALLLYRDRLAWKPLLVGVTVALLLGGPYFIYDAFHSWENMRGLAAYTGGEGVFSWAAARFALMLTGSAGIEGQAGGFYREFWGGLLPLRWLNPVMMGLVLIGLGYALYQAVRAPSQERRRLCTLLTLWFAVPILLQSRPSAPPQFHYFVMHYPVQFLLVAVMGVDCLDALPKLPWRRLRRLRPVGWTLLLALLVVWSIWQVSVTLHLRGYMAAHPTTGGYGIPLAYTRPAAQAARQLAGDAEIIVVGTGNRPFITETPTVFDALLFGHLHRFTDGRSALPVPESTEGVYLVGPMQDTPDDPLWPMIARLAALPSVEAGPAVTLPDGWTYRTFLRRGADRGDVSAGMTPLAAGIPLANKVVFAAAELPQTAKPGAALEVWLTWWLQGPPPAADYHLTVQLLDAAGGLAAQDDHAAFPADTWRVGDLVLNRLALPLPATLPEGEYTVRAGMYTYPDITGVPVVDASGNPIDDGVILGTVVLQNP
ncbi:MAG TPA: glycosyltransferase family 39 protein [Anaerolineae bacterium]|nr:glycosyltransferase family 39 protein [Anaerolineae bacterium]